MKLTDDELLEIVERYDLGELQEAVLAELDSAEWVSAARLADAVLKPSSSFRTKLRKWERMGLVELRRVGKNRRYEVRLPREWPPPRAAETTDGHGTVGCIEEEE